MVCHNKKKYCFTRHNGHTFDITKSIDLKLICGANKILQSVKRGYARFHARDAIFSATVGDDAELLVHKAADGCTYYVIKNTAFSSQTEAIRVRRWCVIYKV
jgi:hypothetical protein